MASAVIMMVAGAVLNATAFTGSMYLAKSLGSDEKHVDEEKIRHDKAIERYQQDMGEFEKKRQQYQDFLTSQYVNKKIADNNLQDTDYAFTLYNKAHPEAHFDPTQKPQFSDYYKPNNKQKNYQMIYVGSGMLVSGFLLARYL